MMSVLNSQYRYGNVQFSLASLASAFGRALLLITFAQIALNAPFGAHIFSERYLQTLAVGGLSRAIFLWPVEAFQSQGFRKCIWVIVAFIIAHVVTTTWYIYAASDTLSPRLEWQPYAFVAALGAVTGIVYILLDVALCWALRETARKLRRPG